MSCHVIIRNRLSLSMGSWDVVAGANPSLVSRRGQGTPWTIGLNMNLINEE